MTSLVQNAASALPDDATAGALVGRVWRPDVNGPSVVAVRPECLVDITATFATVRDLCEAPEPSEALRRAQGDVIGSLESILANTPPDGRDPSKPWLLAPVDPTS